MRVANALARTHSTSPSIVSGKWSISPERVPPGPGVGLVLRGHRAARDRRGQPRQPLRRRGRGVAGPRRGRGSPPPDAGRRAAAGRGGRRRRWASRAPRPRVADQREQQPRAQRGRDVMTGADRRVEPRRVPGDRVRERRGGQGREVAEVMRPVCPVTLAAWTGICGGWGRRCARSRATAWGSCGCSTGTGSARSRAASCSRARRAAPSRACSTAARSTRRPSRWSPRPPPHRRPATRTSPSPPPSPRAWPARAAPPCSATRCPPPAPRRWARRSNAAPRGARLHARRCRRAGAHRAPISPRSPAASASPSSTRPPPTPPAPACAAGPPSPSAPTDFLLDLWVPVPSVLIVGSGAIGAALADQAALLGWTSRTVDGPRRDRRRRRRVHRRRRPRAARPRPRVRRRADRGPARARASSARSAPGAPSPPGASGCSPRASPRTSSHGCTARSGSTSAPAPPPRRPCRSSRRSSRCAAAARRRRARRVGEPHRRMTADRPRRRAAPGVLGRTGGARSPSSSALFVVWRHGVPRVGGRAAGRPAARGRRGRARRRAVRRPAQLDLRRPPEARRRALRRQARPPHRHHRRRAPRRRLHRGRGGPPLPDQARGAARRP